MMTENLMTISVCPTSGDDIAGIVEAAGDDVHGYKIGDCVTALNELGLPFGS